MACCGYVGRSRSFFYFFIGWRWGFIKVFTGQGCGLILFLNWCSFLLHWLISLFLKKKSYITQTKKIKLFRLSATQASQLTLTSKFFLVSVASFLFFHILFPFWKQLRILASSDSRSWKCRRLSLSLSWKMLETKWQPQKCRWLIFGIWSTPSSVFEWDQRWTCLPRGLLWVSPEPVWCLVWPPRSQWESSCWPLLENTGWCAPGISLQNVPVMTWHLVGTQ